MNLDRVGVAPFKSLLRDIMVWPEEWVCETCGALRNETPAGVFESLWAEGFTAQMIEDWTHYVVRKMRTQCHEGIR